MNVYKNIWLSPKLTFEEISKHTQSVYLLPLIIIGFVFSFDLVGKIDGLLGEGSFLWSLLITIPAGMAVSFLVFALIVPGLVRLFGKIWKGAATMKQLINVCSVAFIPYSLILIYQVILFAFGQEPSLDQVNGGINYILYLWSFGLLVVGVAKVQKFSYGMALLNILLSYSPIFFIGLMR